MKTRNTLIASAILIALSAPVLATNNGKDDDHGKPNQNPTLGQAQGQLQGQIQGQAQGQALFSSNKAQSLSNSSSKVTASPTSYSAGSQVNGVVSSNPISGATGTGTGGTGVAESGSGGNILSSNYQQVKQAPMAWSPNMALSMSPENCSNSVSFGASAGFGAISAGAPMDSDACNRRMDTRMWVALGQLRIACERMKMDGDNATAMQKAGVTCDNVVNVVSAPVAKVDVKPVNVLQVKPAPVDWDALARRRDAALSRF